jgi:hypothetical protein
MFGHRDFSVKAIHQYLGDVKYGLPAVRGRKNYYVEGCSAEACLTFFLQHKIDLNVAER